MPLSISLARYRAQLREVKIDGAGNVTQVANGQRVTVQFNPESLNVSYNRWDFEETGQANQTGSAAGGSLTVELWFDVTSPFSSPLLTRDVQKLTSKVAYFVMPGTDAQGASRQQPGVQFLWGPFLFNGFMSSFQERFEFFAADGTPLRSQVTITIMNSLGQSS